jgi:hypothetical protein
MNQDIDFSQIPLRDIHLPGEIAWWPPAPGWWLLLLIALGVAGYFALRYAQRFRERAALKALAGVVTSLEQGAEPTQCLARVSSIMRRFAMSIAERPGIVAGLVGERWLRYLDSRWERESFSRGPGRALVVAPYAPACSREDALELAHVCADWVKLQRARD